MFVAVSDNIKTVPDQIAPWVPGGLTTLGTDGFGRSDTRANLRRFFEVDAEFTVIATLYALAQKGQHAEAVKHLHKAIELQPESAWAHYYIGASLLKTGDYKTAAVHLEIASGRLPGFAGARTMLAEAQKHLATSGSAK